MVSMDSKPVQDKEHQAVMSVTGEDHGVLAEVERIGYIAIVQ